jgi:hypothetical protein
METRNELRADSFECRARAAYRSGKSQIGVDRHDLCEVIVGQVARYGDFESLPLEAKRALRRLATALLLGTEEEIERAVRGMSYYGVFLKYQPEGGDA